MVRAKSELETNRLVDPKAGYFELRIVFFLAFLIATYVVWCSGVSVGNILLSEGVDKFPSSFDTFILMGIAPFTPARGIYWTELAFVALWVVIAFVAFRKFRGRGGVKPSKAFLRKPLQKRRPVC